MRQKRSTRQRHEAGNFAQSTIAGAAKRLRRALPFVVEPLESRAMLSAAYQLLDLGTLGSDGSKTTAINELGQVVAGSGFVNEPIDYSGRPFVFSDANHNRVLDAGETLPINSGSFDYGAIDIHAIGSISALPQYGGALHVSNSQSSFSYAFRFVDINRNGSMDADELLVLGDFPQAGAGVFAIDDSTRFVGAIGQANGIQAFVFYESNLDTVIDNGELVTLGTLGGTNSAATAMSRNGMVVGWSELAGGISHAFAFNDFNDNQQVDPNEIRDLHPAGFVSSAATGVNNRGQVVGYATDSDGRTTGFVYEDFDIDGIADDNEFTFIDDAQAQGTKPASINERGQVVGSVDTGNGTYGFFWDPVTRVVRNLGTLQADSTYTVTDAVKITDRGQIAATAQDTDLLPRAVVLLPNDEQNPTASLATTSVLLVADADGRVSQYSNVFGVKQFIGSVQITGGAAPLLASTNDGRIYAADPATGEIYLLTPQGQGRGYAVATVLPSDSGLGPIKALATDSQGTLYAARADNSIVNFDFSGFGSFQTFISAGGNLVDVTAMIFDATGNLLVAQRSADNVLRFSPAGTFDTDLIPSSGSSLDGPSAMAITPDGRLLICSTVGVSKVMAYRATDGTQLSEFIAGGPLDNPEALAIIDDRLLISNAGDGLVLEFSLDSGRFMGSLNSLDSAINGPGAILLTANITPPSTAADHFDVFVTYDDDHAIDPSTIGDADLSVIGPGSQAMIVNALSSNSIYPRSPFLVVYRITSPDGTFTPANNGLYSFVVNGQQVSDPDGNTVLSRTILTAQLSFSGQPTATFLGPSTVTTQATDFTFNVLYASGAGIDTSTLDDNDILVVLPDSSTVAATFVGFTTGSPGVTASYLFDAPGGSFDGSNNGNYGVQLVTGQVTDNDSVAIASGLLGSFSVNVTTDAPPTAVVTGTTAFTAEAATLDFTVLLTDDLGINNETLGTNDDLTVTLPGGAVVPAVLIDSTGTSTSLTLTYRITAPDGLFSANENGSAIVSVIADSITDTGSNVLASGAIGLLTLSFPDAAPTAALGANQPLTNPASFFNVTVIFSDNLGIDLTTLGNDDLTLTPPSGSDLTGSFISSTSNLDHTIVTATYQFTAADGQFDAAENGNYVVNVLANSVRDTNASAVSAQSLGSVTIQIGVPLNLLVTNTDDSGPGSLRQAILDANAHQGADHIRFNIDTGSVAVITLASELPTISETVDIDGFSQPGSTTNNTNNFDLAQRMIRITGTSLDPTGVGLRIDASSVSIAGLIITDFADAGVIITGDNALFTGSLLLGNGVGLRISAAANATIGGLTNADRNTIGGNTSHGIVITDGAIGARVIGNFIGIDAGGATASTNGGDGIHVENAGNNNVIGDASTGGRNVISGNTGAGIRVISTAQTKIFGNLIGLAAAGAAAVGNQGDGVTLTSAVSTVIGSSDTTDGRANVISGNSGAGVFLSASSSSIVQSNFIGTDIDGTLSLGNNGDGVVVSDGSGVKIGVDGLAGNLISGNQGYGIRVTSAASEIGLFGNYIGTSSDGLSAIANELGGLYVDVDINELNIGSASTGNLISGNRGSGIYVATGSSNVVIRGNAIGTNLTTSASLANQNHGILSDASIVIGGSSLGQGNVISGNGADGVHLSANAAGSNFEGNAIGTNSARNAAIGNAGVGIAIQTNNVLVGGTFQDAGNVISGNSLGGVSITGSSNSVLGNAIGTNFSGSVNLGNGNGSGPNRAGVVIHSGNANLLGPDSSAPLASPINGQNIIAFNTGPGIAVLSGTGNAIRTNLIYANTGLGIDLNNDGITANDDLDADTGPNRLQNFPIITSATFNGSRVLVTGTIATTPNDGLTLSFYANSLVESSGFGEGERFLGTASVSTDSSGNGSFTFTFTDTLLPGNLTPLGSFVTATASSNSNTSEFSQRRVVTADVDLPAPVAQLFVDDLAIARSPAQTFVVRYSSDVGIDFDTIGQGDITVTGPSSFVATATFIDAVRNGDALAPVVATYRINRPSGFTPGQYNLTVAADQVSDTAQQFMPATALGSFNVVAPDVEGAGPTARLKIASQVTQQGLDGILFRATFVDEDSIPNIASIGSGDFTITGPNGFSASATLVDKALSLDGVRVVATYLIPAPLGGFTAQNSGDYTVSLVTGAVQDALGNDCTGNELASFTVDIPVVNLSQLRKAQRSVALLSVTSEPINFTITGPGIGTLDTSDGLTTLRIDQTTSRSKLTITGASKENLSLDRIVITGALGSLVAPDLTLSGSLSIAGGAASVTLAGVQNTTIQLGASPSGKSAKLTLGSVVDSSVTSLQRVASLNVSQWLDTDLISDTFIAPSLRSLQSDGDFHASLQLTDASVGLKRVVVSGAVSGSPWQIAGRAGNVTIASVSPLRSNDWSANFGRGVTSLRIDDQRYTSSNPTRLTALLLPESGLKITLTPIEI